MSRPLKAVLIVEDQPDAQDMLQEVVQEVHPDADITTCATVSHALMQVQRPWHLVLIDLRLLDGSGLDVLRRFKAVQPQTSAIVTSLCQDDTTIFQALQIGADGYLLKSDPPTWLVASLRRMCDGEPPLSPAVARLVLKHFRGLCSPMPTHATEQATPLSPRENEVLAALGEGLSIQETGVKLGISPHTTNDHVKSIYRKLGISSRAQAATEAMRRGLLG